MADIGDLIYRFDVDRATIGQVEQTVAALEARLTLDPRVARSYDEVAAAFKRDADAAKAAASATQPLADTYRDLRATITGVAAEQRAAGQPTEQTIVRLRGLRDQAVALAPALEDNADGFAKFQTLAARAESSAERFAKQIKRVDTEARRSKLDDLRRETSGLRNEWIASGKDAERITRRLHEITTEALRQRPAVEADARAFDEWSRVAAQAERTAAGLEGRLSRLGLAEQVRAGVQDQVASSLGRLGPAGQVAAAGLRTAAGASGAANLALLGVAGGVAAVGTAAVGLTRRGIPEVIETQRAFNTLRVAGETDLEAIAQRLRDLQSSGGRAARTFSRSELAGALAQTVKAGTDADTALRLLGVGINLAAAEGEDLTESTTAVLRNLRQFNLDVSEAARLGNLLAAAGNAADGSARDLSDGLATIGPVASRVGFSLAEALAVLVTLDNKGLSAAETGATAFRQVLVSLLDPSDEARATLKGLGVSLETLDGRARPARDVLIDLRAALDGNAEAANTAAKIFTANGVTAILALDDSIETLADSLDNSEGALVSFADTMTDDLGASFTEVGTALDDLANSFVTLIAPALRTGAEGLAEFIRKLDASVQAVDRFVNNPNLETFAAALGLEPGHDFVGVDEFRGLLGLPPRGSIGAQGGGRVAAAPSGRSGGGFTLEVDLDTAPAEAAALSAAEVFALATAEARRLGAAVDAAVDPASFLAARDALEQFTTASETNRRALEAVQATDAATERIAREAGQAAALAARTAEQAAARSVAAFQQRLRAEAQAVATLVSTLNAQVDLKLIKPGEAEAALRAALIEVEATLASLGPLESPEAIAEFLNLVAMRAQLAAAIAGGIEDALDARLSGAKLFAEKLSTLTSANLLDPTIAREQLRASLDGIRAEISAIGPLTTREDIERLFNLRAIEDVLAGALDDVKLSITPQTDPAIAGSLAAFENYRRDAEQIALAERQLADAAEARNRALRRGEQLLNNEIRANKRAILEEKRRQTAIENSTAALAERERLNRRSLTRVFNANEARLEAAAIEAGNRARREAIRAIAEQLRASDYASRRAGRELDLEKELAREYRNQIETRKRQVRLNAEALQQIERTARAARDARVSSERYSPENVGKLALSALEQQLGTFENAADAIDKALAVGVLSGETLNAIKARFAETFELGGAEAVASADRALAGLEGLTAARLAGLRDALAQAYQLDIDLNLDADAALARADRLLAEFVTAGQSRFEQLRETYRASLEVGERLQVEVDVLIGEVDALQVSDLDQKIDALLGTERVTVFDDLRADARQAALEVGLTTDELQARLDRINAAQLGEVEQAIAGLFDSDPGRRFDELRERARIAFAGAEGDAERLAEALGAIDTAEGIERIVGTLGDLNTLASAAERAIDSLLSGNASAGDLIKQVGEVGAAIANLIPGGQAIAPIIAGVANLAGTVVDTLSRLFDPTAPARRALAQGIAGAVESGVATGLVAGMRGESDARAQALAAIRTQLETTIAQALITGAGLGALLAPLIEELAAASLSGDERRINAAVDALGAAVDRALPGLIAASEAVGQALDRIAPAPSKTPNEPKPGEPGFDPSTITPDSPFGLPQGARATEVIFTPAAAQVIIPDSSLARLDRAAGQMEAAATLIHETFRRGAKVNVDVSGGGQSLTSSNVRLAQGRL